MSSKTALDMPPAKWREYHPFKREAAQGAPAFSLAEAQAVARAIGQELVRRFGAKRVVMFGSLARGDFGRRSDIDLAVWGIPAADFYRAVAFASGYSSAWEVNLVDAEDCPGSLREVITREGVEV